MFARHSDEIVRLVTANSPLQAHRWRQALEAAAIDCRVVGEYLGSFGVVPPGHPVPELWVRREDVERVRAILEGLNKQPPAPGRQARP